MRAREQGIALITALVVLAIIALLVFGTFFTTQIELWITRNDVTSTQANYVAQAGLQKYKAALFQYFRWIEHNYEPGDNPERTSCFNRLGQGIDWDRNDSDGMSSEWGGTKANKIVVPQEPVMNADLTEVIGHYDVTIYRDLSNNNLYTIESVGHSGGATSTARATFLIDNSGILEQAIFAGQGQGNNNLNGGAIIRGGVYVVGDPANDDAIVIDANGDFQLLNSYNLNNSTYNSGVAITSYVNSDNHVANNLCSTLRVEHGKIAVGGSANLGKPDNKLLGVYIGDDGIDDIEYNGSFLSTCTDTKGVCTDDIDKLDLRDPPSFPTFNNSPHPENCSESSWRACIHNEARNHGLMVVANGDPVIKWPEDASPGSPPQSCLDALTNAIGNTIAFNTQTVDCSYTLQNASGTKGGFYYDGSSTPARLEVYGSVALRGYNVIMERPTIYRARSQVEEDGSYTTLNNAAFVVEDLDNDLSTNTYGNLDINDTFLPDTTNTGTGDAHFPNHVLALIAENDIYQRGKYVMAPIYAGGTFRNVKGNVLFGSVITNVFCTTSAGSDTDCAAGQKSEVVYINTANMKPKILQQIDDQAGEPIFRVLSYELR